MCWRLKELPCTVGGDVDWYRLAGDTLVGLTKIKYLLD